MTARPFIFDTEFDAAGAVVRPSAWQPGAEVYAAAAASDRPLAFNIGIRWTDNAEKTSAFATNAPHNQ